MGWQTCQCGGTGGASGTGGTAGTGGSVGTGGSGTGGGPCPASITDGETTCSQPGLLCQKPCGVESKGTKTCGCVGGVFDCGNAAFGGCHYLPNQDLTCYQLPSSVPACPAETQHNTACSGAACQPCSGYLDSGRNPKVGYCVCAALDSGGLWKCATNLEWPPRVPVSGAGCNTLGFLGPAVTATCQPGSPAEPAGGDIANGTYVATSLGVYGLGIDCFPSDWGTFATTWAFSAGTYQYLSSDTNIMSRRNATFTTVGSTLNITYNCPNSNTGATLYSATPTTFTTFTPGSLSDGSEFTLVETYARIGP
jgi:hypothetical protein